MDSLPVPKTEKDITGDWIKQATGLHPVEGSISITGNVQDGVGFLSNLCRVTFLTETGNKESILVKLLPDHPEFLALTIDQKFNTREVQFCTLVLPQILEAYPDLKKYFCKYYSAKYSGEGTDNYSAMIVMEDLKPLGYEMLNPDESPKWKEHLEDIMKFFAKFHAASYALETRKNCSLSEVFPFAMIGTSNAGALLEFGKGNNQKLLDLLLKLNYPKEMRNAYEELCKNVEPLLTKTLVAGEQHPCLIHGDLWPPNIMVKEGTSEPIKVLDWQLLGYRNPTYDLSVTILTCLPKSELTLANIEYFAKFYFKEFCKSCGDLGIKNKFQDEKTFMELFNTWGMSFGYYWLHLSLDSYLVTEELQSKAGDIFRLVYEMFKVHEFLLKQL